MNANVCTDVCVCTVIVNYKWSGLLQGQWVQCKLYNTRLTEQTNDEVNMKEGTTAMIPSG